MDDKRYTSLQNVVNNVLNDIGTYNTKDYIRYLQFAIRGYAKLNLFHLNVNTTKYLSINTDINTVTLPSDYIDYIKIGMDIGDGQIWTLTKNDNIMLPRGLKDGAEFNDNPKISESSGYGDSVWAFTSYDKRGGGNVSQVRVDREANRIVLNGNLSADTKIVLEYISSGVSEDGNTYIPKVAEEAVMSFIHWKRKVHDRQVPYNEKERCKMEWLEEVAQLESAEFSFTYDEFLDVLYSSYTQSPKR